MIIRKFLKSEGEFPQGIQELVIELISKEDFPQFLEKVSNYDKNTPEFKKFNAFLIQLKGGGAKKRRFDKLVNRYSKMSDYSVSEVEENLKKLINLGNIRPKETLKEEITELFLLITDDSQKSPALLRRLHKMFLELGKKLEKVGYPLDEKRGGGWERLPMETYKMWNYLYLTQNQAHIVVSGSAKDKDLEEFATEIGGTYKNSKIFPKNNSFTNMGGFVKQVNSSEKALKLYKKLRKNASFSWFKDGNTEKIDESSLKILQNVAEGVKYTVNTFNAELVRSYFEAINKVVSGDKKLFLPSKPQYIKSFYDYVVINDGNLNLNPIANSMMVQDFSNNWVSQINTIIRSGNVFSEYALRRNIIDDMYVKLSSQKDKADKDLTYRGIDLSSVDINQDEKELKRTLTNLFDKNKPKADTQSLEEFRAILNAKKQNSQNLEDNLSPTEGKLIENFLEQEAKDAEEQDLPNEFKDYSVVYFSAGQENVFDFPTGETDEAGQEIFEEKTVSEGADYAVLMVKDGNDIEQASKEELDDFIETVNIKTKKRISEEEYIERDKTNILSGLRELAGVKQTELGAYLKQIAEDEKLANMLEKYNENATFPDISFKEVLSFLTLLGGTIGYDIEEVFDEIDENPELAEEKAEELNAIVPELQKEFKKVLFTTLENHVKKLVDSDNTKAFGRFGFDKLSSVMLELEGSVLTKEG